MPQTHDPVLPHRLKVVVSTHALPPQQDVLPSAQVWPSPTHVDGWQVPNCIPAGTEQMAPVQQSAELVQVAPEPWQKLGGAQVPATQMSEQHCAENVHAASTPVQAEPPSPSGGRQVPL